MAVDQSVRFEASPAPRMPGLPLLGSFPALKRDQLGTYERAMREVGDLVRFVAGPPGWRVEVLGVFHPDGAARMLVEAPERYRKDSPVYRQLAQAIGNGLLTSQDERWRGQRRTVAPPLTHRRLAGYAPLIADEAAQLVARWQAPAALGKPVDVHAEMVRLTLRVIGRVLFGADMERAVPRLIEGFPVVSEGVLRRALSPHPLPAWWPTPGNRRAAAAQQSIREVVTGLIADRQRVTDPNAADRQRVTGADRQVMDWNAADLLGLLLAARDPESGQPLHPQDVADQVLVFLLAGHETTATTLACALVLLAGSPQVQQAVRREADEVLAGRPPVAADLDALTYTGQVVREALRLYPPAYAIGRYTHTGDVLCGRSIPPQSVVFASPWAIHRHPRFWPHPTRFDPGRFAPEQVRARHRYAWIPFGVGARACIGMQLALLEATLVLAVLTQAYELTTTVGSIRLATGITLRPAAPLPVRLQPLAAVLPAK